jgi:two-component system LytT family response regulator
VSQLRAIIVDDEPLSRRAMRQLLDARGDVEVVAECADAMSVESYLKHADVVFLDVQMPQRSGLDLARELPNAGPPFVVFVTAYDEYAVPAFETEAVDYLSKPVAPERLERTIARVRERLRSVVVTQGADETPAPEPVEQLLTRVEVATSSSR